MDSQALRNEHVDSAEKRDLLVDSKLGEKGFRIESFVCEKSDGSHGGDGLE